MTYPPPGGPSAGPTDQPFAPPAPSASAYPAPPGIPDGWAGGGANPYGTLGPRVMTANGKWVDVRPWRESTRTLAIMTQALLAVGILPSLVTAYYDAKLKGLLAAKDLEAVAAVSEGVPDLTLVALVSILGSFILLLVWMHRVWTSDRSDQSVYTRGTGLAIGGWFIPVAQFVLVPRAMRDLWRGVEGGRARGQGMPAAGMPLLVLGWWIVWCVDRFLAVASAGATEAANRATTLEAAVGKLQGALTTEFFSCVFSVVSAVLTIMLVQRIMSFTRR